MEEHFPVATTSPRLARRAAERVLGDAVPPDGMDVVRLAVTEIVANSVRHAGLAPDDEIALSLDHDGDRVRIEVLDGGPGFDPTASWEAPAPIGEGGHGLRLVDALTDAWGVESGPPTRVWFEVRSPSDGASR